MPRREISKDQGFLFAPSTIEELAGEATLNILRGRVLGCQRCGLHKGRSNAVFGEGNAERPKICFIGEGPGYYEDLRARPFVGKSGQLLDRMIQAMGLKREEVYITNVVACRPPNNRRPEDEEMAICSKTYLVPQLQAVKPEVIITLGTTAAQALLKTPQGVHTLRGMWHEWKRVPVRCTFHPAYLLRVPTQKQAAWLDLQAVMDRLDLKPPYKP